MLRWMFDRGSRCKRWRCQKIRKAKEDTTLPSAWMFSELGQGRRRAKCPAGSAAARTRYGGPSEPVGETYNIILMILKLYVTKLKLMPSLIHKTKALKNHVQHPPPFEVLANTNNTVPRNFKSTTSSENYASWGLYKGGQKPRSSQLFRYVPSNLVPNRPNSKPGDVIVFRDSICLATRTFRGWRRCMIIRGSRCPMYRKRFGLQFDVELQHH